MHEDLHDVQVDLGDPVILRLVGQQDELDAEQRDEDERGPHGPHVEVGLGLVRHPQLGDEDADDVEQEEKVDHQRGADGAVDDVQQRGVRAHPAPADAGSSTPVTARQHERRRRRARAGDSLVVIVAVASD